MSSVLSLEKFAAVSARLDAGLPKDAVLKEAGLNQQQWEAELFSWLANLSEQIQRHNYELYQRYTQWFLQNRLEAERQLGLSSAPNVASLPPAQRNESGDWEYLRWKQQGEAAPSAAVAPPALVAPPPMVSGVPPMPPAYSPVPPMPGAGGVPPMPSVGGGSAVPPMPPMPGAGGVPPMPTLGGSGSVLPMPASSGAVPPMPASMGGASMGGVPPMPVSAPPMPVSVAPPLISTAPAEAVPSPVDRMSPVPAAIPNPYGNVSPPPFVGGVAPPAPGYADPPPAPAAQAPPPAAELHVPTLSLGDYAMLAAEISVVPEHVERALGKYGIGDPRVWEALQQTWGNKLRADGYEMEAYRERFESAQRHWRSVYKR